MHSVLFLCVCVCVLLVSAFSVWRMEKKRFLHCQVDLPSLAYAGFRFTKEGITAPQTTSMRWITGGIRTHTHTHSSPPRPLQVSVDLDLVSEVELSL